MDNIWIVKSMKWTVFFIVTLVILLPHPLFFPYTQSLDGRSLKFVESRNYVLTSSGYADVNVSEAKRMIETNTNLVILDVRTQEEYEEGHIKNAVLIPLSEFEGRLNELDKEKEILVYCRSGVRSATASQILIDNGFVTVYNILGGIIAWRDAEYWVEIIHEGDLIIDGTQTYVIENCAYIQTGDIYVKDKARLLVENATLVLIMQYDDQNNIYIQDYAIAEIDNSSVKIEYWSASLRLSEQAKANITHSAFDHVGIVSWGSSRVVITNSTLPELSFWEASQVLVQNASVTWTINLDFYFPHIVHLDGLEAGYYQYWNLHRNETVQNVLYDLTVQNSLVAWSLRMHDDAAVEVFNCKIEAMRILLHHAAEIENISLEYYGNWTFRSLVLKNSYVKNHWFIGVDNTMASIENCQLRLGSSGNSCISIAKSSIDWFTTYPDSFLSLGFYEAALTDYLAIVDSGVYIYGNVTFSLGTLSFFSSNITRNYNVIARDMSGGLMENVELSLFDQNDTVVWNGVTDSLGQASFNLTFTDMNYTDTLRLEAAKGNYSATMNVGFLSDTPVILTMRYFADLNGDGTINIIDIALVAKAYGSKPGDENWNEIADMDKNREINIIDIATIAKDYGKTV